MGMGGGVGAHEDGRSPSRRPRHGSQTPQISYASTPVGCSSPLDTVRCISQYSLTLPQGPCMLTVLE